MKFFHISDLHIGKTLYHYNLREEQQDVLQQIIHLAEQEHPDAILIAGDVYDKSVPSAEAVRICDEFLTGLTDIRPSIPVLMISGNHDSAERLDFASSILDKHQVYIAGIPPRTKEEYLKKVTLEDAYGPVDFFLMPFIKPGYVRNVLDGEVESYDQAVAGMIRRESEAGRLIAERRNVILSHQFYISGSTEPERCDSEIETVGNIDSVDTTALEPFDYAALGHIHRGQRAGRESLRYCGTPYPYSVSEGDQEKSVTCVTLGEKGTEPEITFLPLKPLRKVRAVSGYLEEVLKQGRDEVENAADDYVSITLTDEIEAYQPREQLEDIYHRILEIRIENSRTRAIYDLEEQTEDFGKMDPYDIFTQFFKEMNQREADLGEEQLMRQAVDYAQEAEQKGEKR